MVNFYDCESLLSKKTKQKNTENNPYYFRIPTQLTTTSIRLNAMLGHKRDEIDERYER